MPTRYQTIPKPPVKKAAAPGAKKAAAAPIASRPVATGPALTPTSVSAKADINTFLSGQGLAGIGAAAWQRYLDLGGDSNPNAVDVIYQEIRSGAPWTNGVYAQRYPGMAGLASQGLAITESQYQSLEEQYKEKAHAAGLPAGFYDDPTDFGKLIAGQTSPTEYGDRLALAADLSRQNPESQMVAAEFGRLYGASVGAGAGTAYFINPDIALPVLTQQHNSAQAAAASKLVGFGSLTLGQAETIGGLGLSYDQAATALSSAATLKPLETGLVGQANQPTLTQDDLIAAAVSHNADAQKKVQTVQDTRTAQFKGGGSFASSSTGISGLGSAAG